MIKEAAYEQGSLAAWNVFVKDAAPRGIVRQPMIARGPTPAAAPVPAAPVTQAQKVPAPGAAPTAAAAPAAAPAAPAAAAPAAPAAPAGGGFMQSVKEQLPGAVLNTGLMFAAPMLANAFSGSGNQQ